MIDQLNSLTVVFTEFYYWITVVFMFLIHVGFCMYEVGASRHKNHLHTLMKNIMIIPLVTITFFFFGWWIYFAFPYGPGIMGGIQSAAHATPWSELMGPHMGGPPAQEALSAGDTAYWAHLNGVFWAAFLLFSWTAASIVSGSVIERIKSSGFWILAVLIGSFLWIVDAAWGWHWDGWMVHKLGYHDAYASGVIHAIAGGFALGVLLILGPRIGKFRKDGSARKILPHNPWLVCIGIFLIYTGFWGFYAACNVPIIDFFGSDMLDVEDKTLFTATNIYLGPTTLSAITVKLPDLPVRRPAGWIRCFQGRSILDIFRRACGAHCSFSWKRPVSSPPGIYHLHCRRVHCVQHAPLGRTHLQGRRRSGRRRGSRICRVLRCGDMRIRAVGLPGFPF